jgi:hypothetical protein
VLCSLIGGIAKVNDLSWSFRYFPVVTGLLAGTLLLTGCTTPPSPVHTTLVREKESATVMMAKIDGELILIDDECFGLSVTGTDYVAVFPAGTTSDKDSVTVPGLGRIMLGGSLHSAGGFVSPREATVKIPSNCATDEVVESEVP